jgi:hypothetical protein
VRHDFLFRGFYRTPTCHVFAHSFGTESGAGIGGYSVLLGQQRSTVSSVLCRCSLPPCMWAQSRARSEARSHDCERCTQGPRGRPVRHDLPLKFPRSMNDDDSRRGCSPVLSLIQCHPLLPIAPAGPNAAPQPRRHPATCLNRRPKAAGSRMKTLSTRFPGPRPSVTHRNTPVKPVNYSLAP